VATLVAGGLALDVGAARRSVDGAADRFGFPWFAAVDTDQDGLPDWAEEKGWRTSAGETIVTDPRDVDTDDDGLMDGVEAGPLASAGRGESVYVGLSTATDRDSDGDGVGDGDEYFSDMDPRRKDTDGDGFGDGDEVDFGSDPRVDNLNGDAYSDKEEHERGSDPSIFDLSPAQAAGAFIAGVAVGEWRWGARKLARLNEEQLASTEYLMGQIVSGLIGVGDARDLVVDVASLDLMGAIVNAVGLAPLLGDTTKTVDVLARFAKRSGRAELAAGNVIDRLPWKRSTRDEVRRKVLGRASSLPTNLKGGARDYVVYKGRGYVGITNDFARRKREHATAGRAFTPEIIPGATKLLKGEARAIEEFCIAGEGLRSSGGTLMNLRHSIDPKHSYRDQAIAWAEKQMESLAATCS